MDEINTESPQLNTETPRGWDYARVLHLHQRARDAGLISPETDVATFAKNLNESTGSQVFDAGLHDSKLRRASVGIDTAISKTPLPAAFENFFGGIGDLVSPEAGQIGRKMGKDFPRSAAQSALILGGMGITPVAPMIGVPMMAVGGADTFAKTLTDTDSKAAAAVNTGATFLLPRFMSGGASAVSKLLPAVGRDVAETVVAGSRVSIPVSKANTGVLERALDFLGMNLGAAANQELAQQATSLTTGQGVFNPASKEHLFQLALGQLPFLPFQVKDVIKGPGAGEFRSHFELNRAEESTQIMNAASKNVANRNYLTTSEKSAPPTQDDMVMGGGGFQKMTDLGERVQKAAEDLKIDRSKTLMGVPVEKAVEGTTAEVPLLQKQEKPAPATYIETRPPYVRNGVVKKPASKYYRLTEDITNEEGTIIPKDSTISEESLRKAGYTPPTDETPNPFKLPGTETSADKAELVKSAEVAVQTPITTADALGKVADLTNQTGKANGEPEPLITDKVLSTKVEQGTDNGFNIEEAMARAAQYTQNRLNRTAAELQTKLTKAQETTQLANQELTSLPEKAQSVIGQTIEKLSKETSATMDTDLSEAWTRAAVKWAKDPANAELINSQDSAPAIATLGKVLGGAAKLKTLERTRNKTSGTGGAESIFSEEQGGTLKPGVENLTANGQETLGDIVKTENELVKNGQKDLMADVTVDEVKGLKKGADERYAGRVSEVIRQFASGEIQREYKNGKWKFTYNNIEALKQAFGGKISNKTIMDFVKDNHGVIGQVIQERMGVKLLSFDQGKIQVTVDPKLANQPGVGGMFPVSAKAWFTHHFLNKGISPAETSRLSEVAMRLAAAYKEINATRIASLVADRRLGGVSLDLGKNNGAIGINEVSMFAGLEGNKALDQFLKLHTLAHEEFHSLRNAYRAGVLGDEKMKVMDQVYETAGNMSEQDMRFVLGDVFDAVLPRKVLKDRQADDLKQNLIRNGMTSPDEFLATYSGLVMLGVASPSSFKGGYAELKNHIMFGDKHLADFLQNQFLDVLDVSQAYHDFLVLDQNVPKSEAAQMRQFNDAFKQIIGTKEEINESVKRLQFMDAMMDGGLEPLVAEHSLNQPITITDAPPSIDSNYGIKINFQDPEIRKLGIDYMSLLDGRKPSSAELLGQNLNWYERNLFPAAQVAERFPITRPIINLGFTFNSVKNKSVTMALMPFMTPDKFGRLVFDAEHSGLTKTLHDDKINEAFSEAALEQNFNNKALTDDEIASIGSRHNLNSDQMGVLNQTIKNTSLAMQSMATAMLQSRKSLIGNLAGRVLMSRIQNLDAQTAKVNGDAITNAMIASSGQDLNAVAQGTLALQEVQKAVGNPEAFDAAVQAVTGILPKFAAFAQQISDRPWYTPEVRLGDYKLRWVEDGVKHFEGYKTRAEFDAAVEKLHKNDSVESDSIKGYEKFDQGRESGLMSSDMVRKFSEIEQSAFETRKALFPEDADNLDKLGYVPGEATFKEVAAQGIGKYALKRKLVAGRESINMMEGVLDYVIGVSGGLAKGYTRDLASLYLADPSLRANPKIQAFLRDHITSVTSSPKEWTAIKNAVFHFTLGGNISSILVERLQPLFSLAPHLTQNGAGIAGSYKYMGRAMQMLWKIAAKDSSGFDSRLQIPEMLKRASEDRLIDFGVYQELVNHDDLAISNLRNVAMNNPTVNSVQSMLAKPLYWYTKFARNLYTNASSQNNRVAFLSSYLLAMEKGIDGKPVTPDQAYQFAYDTVHTTMFGGGRAGRPVGMFSNLGKTYGAVSAWYMLQHYTTSSIAMMYRLTMDSIGKSGLQPYQAGLARKALGQMVLTQTLMSGTLGLPLVGGTLAVLEQIFPELQAKKAIRETLGKLGGDDHDMGELISDSFLHGGLPRALGLGMIDVSGRFGLGQMFGVDPEYGFRPENVFGAPGSVFGNILRGVGTASTGKVAEGVEQAVPSGFRNLVKMYNDDWNVRDSQGRLLFQPSETETALGAIGFRPKRLSQYREQQQLLQRSDQISSKELLRFHQDLADLLLQGQSGQVKDLLMKKFQEDRLYDPRAGLRAVSQIAQDKSVPVDVNKGGRSSLRERESISQTFSSGPQGRPSEVQLLLRRKQMERQVGIPGAGTLSRSELTVSSLADQFVAQGLSRQLARALAERQLARNPLGR